MKLLALGAMLMTMGCSTVPPAEEDIPVRGETGRKCDASKAQKLVGRQSSKEVGAEVMRLSGAGALRWVPHDGVVTMDYREDRVNVHLDKGNRIVRIACG
jgi:hypothetical protein